MASRKAKSTPKSNTRGGKRPGSGRKSSEINRLRADFNQIATDLIAPRLPGLLENMFRLADGVWREQQLPDGTNLIYKSPPDRGANEYLMNRLLGKPVDRHEHNFGDLTDEELVRRVEGALAGNAPAGADPGGEEA